jgi:hypothetical protein
MLPRGALSLALIFATPAGVISTIWIKGKAGGLFWGVDSVKHAIDFFAKVLKLNGGEHEVFGVVTYALNDMRTCEFDDLIV